MKKMSSALALLATALLFAPPVGARVKLVSLPERRRAVLRLDHPDAVLVQEERTVTLQRGLNRLDFSWKLVSVEPGSIQLEPLDEADRVEILNVSFPPEENALVWEVRSQATGPVRVRISYLIRGIRRIVSYRAVANADETALTLRSYLKLQNFSGESFERVAIEPGYGARFEKRLENGESKEMLSFVAENVPIEKTFTYDPAEFGDQVVAHYAVENTPEGALGSFPLLAGKVRLFQENSEGAVTFVGEDWAEFTPVGEGLELRLGDARDIAVKRTLVATKKIPRLREQSGHIRLYDSDETYRYELESFRDAGVALTVVDHAEDTWTMVRATHAFKRTDSRTIEFTVELPPHGEPVILEYTVRRENLE